MRTYLSLIALIIGGSVLAQIPEGYYSETDGLSGGELKHKLHQIIRGHTVWSYAEFRDTILPALDEDPDNAENIILFYKGASIPKVNFASNNQPDYWNREHTWPKSHGFAQETDTAYTDVHNLRPSDATVNTSKSNKDFDDIEDLPENEEGEAEDTYTNTDFFEPRDAIKGDVARILFYMDTRYESKFMNLELVDRKSYSGDPEFGVLYTLLKWHEEDPVSEEETARHEGAYGYQGNRNPFVDHPEWVARIWGDVSGAFMLVNEEGFNPGFGTVSFGDSLVQQVILNGYQLEGDVTASVSTPFFISQDGENYVNEIVLTHTEDQTEEHFSMYLMFRPDSKTGEYYSDTVIFTSTHADTLELLINGEEGEASVISIAQARERELGEMVSVTGVVIDAGNNSTKNRVIYDGTAGIVIRSDADDQTADLVQGDSVVISGGLTDYYELLEINEAPITVELISQGAALPEPQELTISEVGENYESELVILRDVTFDEAGSTFAYGNWGISDGTGSLILRIGADTHPIGGQVVPGGTCDITGYIGQYNGDYQLFIRNIEDIVEVSPQYELITIEEARKKAESTIVKVRGIILGGPSNSESNRVLFDGTGGIVVRSMDEGNESAYLFVGDSAVVTGGLYDYNGLLEIEKSPVQITILNGGNDLPDPQEVVISEIDEEYESELIILKSVFFLETGVFAPGEYVLTDGSSSITLSILLSDHPLVGKDIPAVPVNLIAYVGQNSDGYYLLTRSEEDLEILEVPLTSWEVIASESVGIYPNPAEDKIYLALPGEKKDIEILQILSQEGKVLRKITGLNTTDAIDLSRLTPGLFILSAQVEGVIYLGKLIKK